MEIKVIALDLDNTTLKKSSTLSVENKRAIENAIAQGIEVVVASGRTFTSLPEQVLEISGIRYAITSNGAAVYEMPGDAEGYREKVRNAVCIRRNCLPADRVDAVLRCLEAYPLENYPISFEVFIEGQAYAYAKYIEDPMKYGISEAYLEYVRNTRVMVDDIFAFIEKHKNELDGLDLQIGDPALCTEVREKLAKEVHGIYMTSSVPNRVEIAHPEAGKAAGLRLICEQLGISMEHAAAFGDADNDVEMLQEAGVGIAVANATRTCKDAADHITKAARKDGVAYGIYHFLGVTDRETAARERQEERAFVEAHAVYMREALKEAEKALALDEVPIGCVIVKDGAIIARGYNRRNTDKNTLSHAELNAIRAASEALGDWRLEGCTMYVTLEPCQMCAGALVQSRIDEVVIGSMNPKAGCAGSVLNLMQVPQFNHQVKLVKGILGTECSRILHDFFTKLRTKENAE